MSAPDTTVVQVNIKTPAGTLINFYGENVVETKEIIEAAIEELANTVAAAEQAFNATSNVAKKMPVANQQPAAAAQPAPQFGAIAAEPPAADAPTCEHGEPMRHVPGGVSKKTGKPYGAFWACARDRASQCNAKVAG